MPGTLLLDYSSISVVTNCSQWVTDLKPVCHSTSLQVIILLCRVNSFFLFLCTRERRRWCGHKEERVKFQTNEEGKEKGWEKRNSCASGLRMSCELMSVDESWLLRLTQFFALLVTVLSLMMFAPDYWCKSQCGIVCFWSCVFLIFLSFFFCDPCCS